MQVLRKQDVKLNRERIRKNIINCLTLANNETVQKGSNFIKNIKKHQSLKLKPNSSEFLSFSDDNSYLKHIFPCSTFQTMFELLQKVGQGSHSEVYKCRDLKTDKIFAVKLFLFLQPENMRHVKQHYRIQKLLSHQNIVKANFLFFHLEKKRMAIVREYCPFGTLRSFLQKNPNISNQTIAKIIFNLMSGIQYMHRHGVCHRDIKPENIMYSKKTGDLKIIDFELAKMQKYADQKLEMWTITGTLQYKAPQMFKGCYNEAIDVWAVGVIIYEMVYKKLPFESEYVSDTITVICEKQPNYEGVEIHACLLSIIKGCLIKNPLKRMKAIQVLKSPFMLKFKDGILSPTMKRKRRFNTENEEQINQNDYKFKLRQVSKESYSQDDERSQSYTFFEDMGIRFSQQS